MTNNQIEIDLSQLRVRERPARAEADRPRRVARLQDPSGIFELIEVVGNGTYGQVYKVNPPLCVIQTTDDRPFRPGSTHEDGSAGRDQSDGCDRGGFGHSEERERETERRPFPSFQDEEEEIKLEVNVLKKVSGETLVRCLSLLTGLICEVFQPSEHRHVLRSIHQEMSAHTQRTRSTLGENAPLLSAPHLLPLPSFDPWAQLVMEYCGAGSITDLVKSSKGNSLKEEWIGFICKEILNGLNHLHANKIIHRDIKGQVRSPRCSPSAPLTSPSSARRMSS